MTNKQRKDKNVIYMQKKYCDGIYISYRHFVYFFYDKTPRRLPRGHV